MARRPPMKAKAKEQVESLGVTAGASPNYHGVLTPGQIDTINLDRPWSSLSVIVVDNTTTRLDYTLDGSVPAVGGTTEGRVIPIGPATDLITFRGGPQQPTIKLISSAALHYSIVGET